MFASVSHPDESPRVIDIHNVEDDDNCGYRCIFSLMGKGEQNWKQVREDMIKELTLRQCIYHGMYGTDKHYEKVLQALHLAPNEFATEEKWLSVPDMGHIVATMYQVVFVTLSNRGGATYFPLTGPVLHPSEHQIICLLFVNNNHWVKVLISTDFPLPTVNPQWIYHCTVEARGWQLPYLDRMILFNKLSREFMFLLEFLSLSNFCKNSHYGTASTMHAQGAMVFTCEYL
ncbi:uncharacterized protein LOC130735139 [Lotus japonicus]|uniref:uncharacterized protein LOC130735139 n=1 Tax=Lotus japonicus TaxID=34305 RepID=UPI00258EDC78|nr:uncharacterized protein LOC130735139 [Lotus japonicus]